MFGGLFLKKPTKAELEGHKRVRVGGAVYTIRRINPILDFPADKMPSVFTAYQSYRKADKPLPQDPKRLLEDMMLVVRAGVVDPPLVDAKKSNEGITAEDIFRIPENGAALYIEILDHTLNRFKGLRRLFFSIQLAAMRSIASPRHTEFAQAK